MRYKILFSILFSILFVLSLASAEVFVGFNEIDDVRRVIIDPTVPLPTFDNTTAFVNQSNFWVTDVGIAGSINTSHFEINSGNLTAIMSLWDSLYCQLTGCTLTGPLIVPSLNISTFTEGSVIFVGSGGLITEDNDGLFWDASNLRLGIGRAAPLDSIHIDSTGNARIRLDRGVINNKVEVEFRTGTSRDWVVGVIDGNIVSGGTGDEFFISQSSGGSNFAFMIDTTDFVGVGLKPVSTFSVWEDTNGAGGSSTGVTIHNAGTSDSVIHFTNAGNDEWTMGMDNSQGDEFVIAASNTLGTNRAIRIDENSLNIQVGADLSLDVDNAELFQGGASDVSMLFDGTNWIFQANVASPFVNWTGFAGYNFDNDLNISGDLIVGGDLTVTGFINATTYNLALGGNLTSNGTCTITSSPDGSTIQNICDV